MESSESKEVSPIYGKKFDDINDAPVDDPKHLLYVS